MAWPELPPTDLPEFNHLYETLLSHQKGHKTAQEVALAVTQLDLKLGQLKSEFDQAVSFIEPTETNLELFFLVAETFGLASPTLIGLRQAGTDSSQGAPLLRELHEVALHLFDLFRELRENTAYDTVHSQSPPTQDLLRVCQLVSQERLKLASLEAKLEQFRDFHDQLVALFHAPQPLPQEKAVLEEYHELFEQALLDQEDGLGLLYDYLTEPESELMEQAFELLQVSGDTLFEIRGALEKAGQEPPKVVCVQCGAENIELNRFCETCQAPLPRLGLTPEAAISINEAGQDKMVNPFVEELREVGQGLLEGQVDEDDFGELLGAQRHRVESAQRRYSNLPPPPEGSPPEELDLFETACQAMERGFQLVTKGLDLLETFLENPQPLPLEQGLMAIEEGFRAMNAVPQLIESLRG